MEFVGITKQPATPTKRILNKSVLTCISKHSGVKTPDIWGSSTAGGECHTEKLTDVWLQITTDEKKDIVLSSV